MTADPSSIRAFVASAPAVSSEARYCIELAVLAALEHLAHDGDGRGGRAIREVFSL